MLFWKRQKIYKIDIARVIRLCGYLLISLHIKILLNFGPMSFKYNMNCGQGVL